MTKNEMKEQLIQAWKEVFELDEVTEDMDFFEEGGDSIKAVQLSAWLLQKGIKLELGTAFTSPVLSQMAESLKETEAMYVPDRLLTKDIVKEEIGKMMSPNAIAPEIEKKEAFKADQQICDPKKNAVADQQICDPKKNAVADQQICDPKKNAVADQQICDPKKNAMADQQICDPKKNAVADQQICDPKKNAVADQQICDPKKNAVADQQICDPRQNAMVNQQICDPNNNAMPNPYMAQNPQYIMMQGMEMMMQGMLTMMHGQIQMMYPNVPVQKMPSFKPHHAQKNMIDMLTPAMKDKLHANMEKYITKPADKPIEKPVVMGLSKAKVEKAECSAEEALEYVLSGLLPDGYNKTDDLFAQGLSSLDTVKLVTRCGEKGYKVEMKDIYMHSTFDELVKCMKAGE